MREWDRKDGSSPRPQVGYAAPPLGSTPCLFAKPARAKNPAKAGLGAGLFPRPDGSSGCVAGADDWLILLCSDLKTLLASNFLDDLAINSLLSLDAKAVDKAPKQMLLIVRGFPPLSSRNQLQGFSRE